MRGAHGLSWAGQGGAHTSEPQEKLPVSRRSALNLKFPPRQRTRRTVTLDDSFVLAGWRPSSNLACTSASQHQTFLRRPPDLE